MNIQTLSTKFNVIEHDHIDARIVIYKYTYTIIHTYIYTYMHTYVRNVMAHWIVDAH